MKTKTKTYLLLVAILGIWGTIAFKITSGLSPDEPEVLAQNVDVTFTPKPQKKVDTFSITTANRDPFLGRLPSSKKTPKKTKPSTPAPIAIEIPTITYSGLIQKQDATAKVFAVNINNQQYLVKQGQTISDVTLVSGNKSSIRIRFNGTYHTIKR